jgi:ABC-type uncharacterized transport system permease subunit
LSSSFSFTVYIAKTTKIAWYIPIGVSVVAFFFAALLTGSEAMYRTMGIPVAFAQTLQALVLVFVLIGDLFLRLSFRSRKKGAT